MMGVAQKLFAQRTGDNRLSCKGQSGSHSWPTLEKMLLSGCPIHLEVSLAKQLLKSFSEATEEAAFFLCHLCLAARQGHLCVSVSSSEVNPPPQPLWLEVLVEKAGQSNTNLLETIARKVEAGAHRLPSGLIGMDKAVVASNNNYYLKRFWVSESIVAQEASRLLNSLPHPQFNTQQLSEFTTKLCNAGLLNTEQAEAIVQAGSQSLTLITGGPGTGKTYAAGYLIQALWESVDDPFHFEIVAAAPTGKAAANLTASLSRVLSSSPIIKAKTLHSLLGVNRRNQESLALTADLIIVDESSMVDVQLMSRLLTATKSGARIVLLGDSYQLPAVEAGGIFRDLVNALDSRCVSRLQKCHRTESQSILSTAAAVRDGDASRFHSIINSMDDEVCLHPWPDDEAQLWDVIKAHCPPTLLHADYSPQNALQTMNRCRILTPLREGLWGVQQINERLVQWVRQSCNSAPIALPIMIVVNDYSKELFNGDVGILITNVPQPYALFPDGDAIPEAALPRYEFAFALSVHKSQGSEFDKVLLLLPQRSENFGREMVYTAVTRAKKQIEIWSAPNTLETMLQQHMERLSGLQHRNM